MSQLDIEQTIPKLFSRPPARTGLDDREKNLHMRLDELDIVYFNHIKTLQAVITRLLPHNFYS